MDVTNRRPLKTRSAAWAGALARILARVGCTPNGVSVLGVFVSLGGCACLVVAGRSDGGERAGWLAAGAVGIQLRLLCNMLDGLIAVECGLKGKLGDLFNEVPDRIEDTLFLVGAGFATLSPWGPALGAAAALLAGALSGARDPLPQAHPWYILVELTDTLAGIDLSAILETELAAAIADGAVLDGTVAASQAQAVALGEQHHVPT
ncbi:MAG TPA: hypothetical protein PKX00_12370, partial [Opitutaceae bacterium]|nr:hypothetical protein [Opitutaceae bacterium]